MDYINRFLMVLYFTTLAPYSFMITISLVQEHFVGKVSSKRLCKQVRVVSFVNAPNLLYLGVSGTIDFWLLAIIALFLSIFPALCAFRPVSRKYKTS